MEAMILWASNDRANNNQIMAQCESQKPLGHSNHQADCAKNQLQYIIIRVAGLQSSLNAQT